MLRRGLERGVMWVAGAAMGLTAAVSWWSALESGSGAVDLVPPIGFTAAALIWLVNATVAKARDGAMEGDHR